MHENLRRAASALVIAAVLLITASPALAAPREESATAPAFVSTHGFAGLLAWLGSWFDPSPVESYTAPGGHTMDPNGQPTALEGGPPATPDGGHSMDPDG
jgi:hypothetical protein